MMKINKYIFGLTLVLLFGSFIFQSCTKDFEDINQNPYGITTEQLEVDWKLIGEPFKQAQLNMYAYTPAWVTQLQQNLLGDVFSGYMMPPTPFRGNSNNMTYFLVDGWNGYPWSTGYGKVMSPMLDVERAAGDGFPNFRAWAKIIKVEAMHRVSDHYGPIIYSNYGKPNATGGFDYDCQQDVYNMFFEDLDFAINTLTPYANNDSTQTFREFDFVYNGDYAMWIKFANSLRLRLAIRISKVDPAKAEAEARLALDNSFGLLADNSDNFLVNGQGLSHPLNTINGAWHDTRMGAPMESILIGYGDPRVEKYFDKALLEGHENEFLGIRQGIEILAKSDYEPFSALKELGYVQLMTAAEVYFLKAEAALRWNIGGTAQDNYEMGISTSFTQYGLDAAGYITDNTSTPNDYVDNFNIGNNVAAASDITIQWNEGDEFERKLERIIVQKWIAMFPDGQEAWSEFRRTGYPKLWPILVNNSGGTISSTEMIKRVNFVANEINTNPSGIEGANACLGGPDNGGTNLWWDID